MTGKDEFEVARELLRHEDGLVNNRVTWLLVLQGFLFNAYVGGVGLLEKFKGQERIVVCVEIGLVLLATVGIWTSLAAWNVVKIAFDQADRVQRWWESMECSTSFPPLRGSRPAGWFYLTFSTGSMPFLLIAVWTLLALLSVIGVAPSSG